MALPNVPDPVNGMIKTFDSAHRTFSRPYSAKTVFFYKDGDEHFTGIRVPVSKSRYRTIDSLLDDLNSAMYMPFGVRRLTTPLGRTPIEDLDQLQHMGKYVATSSKFPRGIDLSALDRLAKARQQAQANLRSERQGGQAFWVPTSPSYKQKLRMSRSLGLNFVPSKQIFFVLNGDHRLYRTLINPVRLPSMENLLREVSEGLGIAIYRLYNVDLKRILQVNELLDLSPPKVIACPRNSRPSLNEQPRFVLPSINNPYPSYNGPKSTRSQKSTSSVPTMPSIPYSLNGNAIEKSSSLPAFRKNIRKRTGAVRKKPKPKGLELPALETAAVLADKRKDEDRDSGKAASITSQPGIEEDSASSDYPDERNHAALIREELEERGHFDQDVIKDDDYPSSAKRSREGSLTHSSASRHSARETDDTAVPRSDSSQSRPHSSRAASRRSAMKESESRSGSIDKEGRPSSSRRSRHSATMSGRASKLPRPETNTLREEEQAAQADDFFDGEEEKEEEEERQFEEEEEDEEPEERDMIKEEEEDEMRTEEEEIGEKEGEEHEEEEKEDYSLIKEEGNSDNEEEEKEDVEMREEEEEEEAHENDEAAVEAGEEAHEDQEEPEDFELIKEEEEPEDFTLIKEEEEDEEEQEQEEEMNENLEEQLDEELEVEKQEEMEQLEENKEENGEEEPTFVSAFENPSSREHRAATVIQSNFRGYITRKKLKVQQEGPPMTEEEHDLRNLDQEVIEQKEDGLADESVSASPDLSTQSEPANKDGLLTYTIAILTGNRWGADSEVDLYITLYGDEAASEKFLLHQNELSSWLQSAQPKFGRNQLDSFHVQSPQLGTIMKVEVGHTRAGYGAGIFIEHVLVTENVVAGRQFIFFCSKWFDTGQVDGLIERSLPLSALYFISSIPNDDVKTLGRWEFIIHNGTSNGDGGTTSNLTIVGFGTNGSAVTTVKTNTSLQKVPSTSLIQVDFGDIGELFKVRFEIDGVGEQPDYYMDFVEMRDIDTDERLAVSVCKWLDTTGRRKRSQAFREISVFRAGAQALSMNNYEGKVTPGDQYIMTNETLTAQLVGELSDSGVFPLKFDGSKKEYSFNIECVHLGRIQGMKVFGDFTKMGQDILEGFSILQQIWDIHGIPDVTIAKKLIATKAVVIESKHCPYKYKLGEGRVAELEDDGPKHKQLMLITMDGRLTRNKKDQYISNEDDWMLELGIGDSKPKIFITVSLVVGMKEYTMQYDTEHPENELLYRLKCDSIGLIDKVRIGVDPLEKYVDLTIKKMRLSNGATHAEMRLPVVETVFQPATVYEFPAIYPDISPKQSVIYTIALETVEVTGTFLLFIQVEGEKSSTGFRPPPDHWNLEFENGSREQFDLEAVDIGQVKSISMRMERCDQSSRWIGSVRVAASTSEEHYDAGELTLDMDHPVEAAELKEI